MKSFVMTRCPKHGIQVGGPLCFACVPCPDEHMKKRDRRKEKRDDIDIEKIAEEARKHVDDNDVGYWAKQVLSLVDVIRDKQD